MRRPALFTLVTLTVGLALGLGGEAHAQDPSAQGKTLFNVGAEAYASGRFVDAAAAFEEANKLTPRPGLVFSIAQAHRRQYVIDKSPDQLRAAIASYRDYIGKVAQGGRRSDAAAALAELEPLAARLDPGPSPQASPPPVAEKPLTRLAISTEKGAMIALDADAPTPSPFMKVVRPGPHRVRLAAEGYLDEERELTAVEGSLVALDIPLREKPARVEVVGTAGAQVTVDGRPSGSTPLPSPLELSPGMHLVSVTRTGYRPFSQELDVARGETRKLEVALEGTTQRTVSYVMMLSGAGGVVVGAVFGGLAFQQQGAAKDILTAQGQGNITPAQLTSYDAARDGRDNDKRIAAVALGAGGGVAVLGLLLYAFDQPSLAGPLRHRDDKAKPPAPAHDMPMEMRAAPVFGPGYAGTALTGHF